MKRWCHRATLSCFLLGVGFGCTQPDVVARFSSEALPGDRASFSCNDQGPILVAGDSQCLGEGTETAFRFGLCTCEEVVSSSSLRVDAFDSREGPYVVSTHPGALGSVGRPSFNGPVFLSGDLLVSDFAGAVAGGAGDLEAENLSVQGPFQSDGRLLVRQIARVGGDLRARDLEVGGTLFQPEGAIAIGTQRQVVGQSLNAPVSVPPPCDCEPSRLLDIGSIVAARENENDNARFGFEATSLVNVSGDLDLSCGRYYFDRLSTVDALNIRVNGRVVFFVAGDLVLSHPLRVELVNDAELDLIVAGQVLAEAPLNFGDSAAPLRTRLYLGGQGTLQIDGGGTFSGMLYAPRTELVVSAPLEVLGSLFVRRLSASDNVTVHYDVTAFDDANVCN